MAPGSIKIPWKSPTPFDADRKRTFCEHFAKTHLWTESSAVAGIDYATARAHFRDDPVFRADVEVAKKQHLDSIEREIHRRGIVGWVEQTTHYDENNMLKSKSKRTRMSDKLLLAYAKRNLKAYRGPPVETPAPTINVNTQVNVDFGSLAPAQRDALRAFLAATPVLIPAAVEPVNGNAETVNGTHDSVNGSNGSVNGDAPAQ